MPIADRLMHVWRQARQDAGRRDINERLVIGSSLRLWGVVSQNWVQHQIDEMPNLGIIAEVHSPDRLMRRLVDGIIDTAIINVPQQIELSGAEKVTKLTLRLVASRPNIALKEAMSSGYIYVDWGYAYALRHRQLYPDISEARIRVALANMALSILLENGGSAYIYQNIWSRNMALKIGFTL